MGRNGADDVVRDINAMDVSCSSISVSATLQFYPPAAASHDEVSADPQLFHKTLNDLYSELGIKVSKFMKLGGQELNLHLLYKRVTSRGGSVQVIKEKQWRDVGDAFQLPKTITSVSFVLKRGYMQYLWDYEQVYFQGRGSQARLLAPVSRYTKDSGNPAAAAAFSCLNPAVSVGEANAAAAVAVTPLSSYTLDGGAQFAPTMTADPVLTANPLDAADQAVTKAASNTYPVQAASPNLMTLVGIPATPSRLPSIGAAGSLQVTAVINSQSVSVSGMLANVPIVGVLNTPLMPLQDASNGLPAAINSPKAIGKPVCALHQQQSVDLSKSKRQRAVPSSATTESVEVRETNEDGVDVGSAMTERPLLPETIYSLLSKIALRGDHAWLGASTQLTPSGRCAAVWMELDAHKRSVVQSAVRADEERFRAEQALWDAQIVAEAARRRRFEAMQSAGDTLLRSDKGVAEFGSTRGSRCACMGKRDVSRAADAAGRASVPPADLALASQPSSPSTHVGAASMSGEPTPRTPNTFAVPFSAPMHAIHQSLAADPGTLPSSHASTHAPAALQHSRNDPLMRLVDNPHDPLSTLGPFNLEPHISTSQVQSPTIGELCALQTVPDITMRQPNTSEELMYAADMSDVPLEAWMPTDSWDCMDIRDDSEHS